MRVPDPDRAKRRGGAPPKSKAEVPVEEADAERDFGPGAAPPLALASPDNPGHADPDVVLPAEVVAEAAPPAAEVPGAFSSSGGAPVGGSTSLAIGWASPWPEVQKACREKGQRSGADYSCLACNRTFSGFNGDPEDGFALYSHLGSKSAAGDASHASAEDLVRYEHEWLAMKDAESAPAPKKELGGAEGSSTLVVRIKLGAPPPPSTRPLVAQGSAASAARGSAAAAALIPAAPYGCPVMRRLYGLGPLVVRRGPAPSRTVEPWTSGADDAVVESRYGDKPDEPPWQCWWLRRVKLR